jgi:DNA-binding transcriptional LysR family regulator
LVDPAIARFARLRPDIEVEVDVSADMRDLLAGQADLALRGGYEPTEPHLIRRKLMDDPFAVYCSEDYPSPPSRREELGDHWIACFDVLRPRFEAGGLGHRVKHVTNSATALRSIIAAGNVVGPLPRSVGEAPPALKRCFGVAEPIGVWLVYPERMRGFPGLKELSAAIATEARRVTRLREEAAAPDR